MEEINKPTLNMPYKKPESRSDLKCGFLQLKLIYSGKKTPQL